MRERICINNPKQKKEYLDWIEEQVEEQEGREIATIAREASINGIIDTLINRKRPVMTLEDGSIVRKYPDGRTEIVRKIENIRIPEKIVFHL